MVWLFNVSLHTLYDISYRILSYNWRFKFSFVLDAIVLFTDTCCMIFSSYLAECGWTETQPQLQIALWIIMIQTANINLCCSCLAAQCLCQIPQSCSARFVLKRHSDDMIKVIFSHLESQKRWCEKLLKDSTQYTKYVSRFFSTWTLLWTPNFTVFTCSLEAILMINRIIKWVQCGWGWACFDWQFSQISRVTEGSLSRFAQVFWLQNKHWEDGCQE